ncbi:Bdr family repetitive protein [Borrelia sp. P9F1]|uniref:Bdr family repetitive protein n=1 Tax=Borrelia sp. P9F1 TaxID=3058374 RepID=UPI002648D4E6|nr:Bdr family repetitive protein [Borrelia sp. P9F1]WKC58471.1 Bdr family repetitive protein [Borrelia sp. P9F1]
MQAQALKAEPFTEQVTQEVIYEEFVNLGMREFVADNLSKRYYHNQLTYKDLEHLESKFDLKLGRLEDNLKNEIAMVRNEIAMTKMEIKGTLKLHSWMFGTIITLNIGLFLTLVPLLYTVLKGS